MVQAFLPLLKKQPEAYTLRVEAIRNAVIYEPPFYSKGLDRKRVEKFHQEVSSRKWVSALTTAREIVKLAPLPIRLAPRWLRERLTVLSMKSLGGGNGYAPLNELPPAMRFDFQLVGEMSQHMKVFAQLDKELLLLGGTKIPKNLKLARKDLASTLRHPASRTLAGLNHAAPWNEDRGGSPLVVAQAIREYILK